MKKFMLIFFGIFLLTGCFFMSGENIANKNLESNEKELLKAVEKVKNKKLKVEPDSNGSVYLLPNAMKHLSDTGAVYVYQNDDNGVQVGFFVVRGILGESTELLYSSGGEKMMKANSRGNYIKKLNI